MKKMIATITFAALTLAVLPSCTGKKKEKESKPHTAEEKKEKHTTKKECAPCQRSISDKEEYAI